MNNYKDRRKKENYLNESILKLNLILFAIRFLASVGIYLFIILLVIFIYWNFESDPLKIEKTSNNIDILSCKDNTFTFDRKITSDKYLDVKVSQEFKDLTTGEIFSLPNSLTYSITEGVHTYTYYKKLPKTFKNGLYEYTPKITYNINPIKTIVKDAPSQKVNFSGNN